MKHLAKIQSEFLKEARKMPADAAAVEHNTVDPAAKQSTVENILPPVDSTIVIRNKTFTVNGDRVECGSSYTITKHDIDDNNKTAILTLKPESGKTIKVDSKMLANILPVTQA